MPRSQTHLRRMAFLLAGGGEPRRGPRVPYAVSGIQRAPGPPVSKYGVKPARLLIDDIEAFEIGAVDAESRGDGLEKSQWARQLAS
jgi:hypothetical protein